MRNYAVSWGCGIVATAPLFAGHLVFINEIKFILISWFSSFISTFLLIFCSLSSLFTKNPWFIFLFSIPFDVVGKVLLKFLATKLNFFKSTKDHMSLGFSCGLGFALAHVLTLYLPIVFDQKYSVEIDLSSPDYFPNSLDLALLNHWMSIFHISTGLLLFRFSNLFLLAFLILIIQYGASSMTKIPSLWGKHVAMALTSYLFVILTLFSYRSMKTKVENKKSN